MDGRREARRLGRSTTGKGTVRPAVEPLVAKGRRARRPRAYAETLTEGQLHQSVAELLDWILLPPAVWTTFPAGWGKLGKATAGRLKACGLKDGMPDVLIFDRGRTFGVELKGPRGSRSSAQREMARKLAAAGVMVVEARSPEEVVAFLHDQGVPFRKFLIDGYPSIAVAYEAAEARVPF